MAEYVEMRAVLIPRAGDLLDSVSPSDVDVEVLQQFEDRLPRSGVVDCFNAAQLVSVCGDAMSTAKLYSKVCKAFALAAERRLKAIKAEMFFAADAELTKAEIKSTDKSKEAWLNGNAKVLAARELRDSWQVLVEFFENSMFEFKDRFGWFRDLYKHDMSTGEALEEQKR